jgi:two-component system sensor histidine kinase UhpB
VMSIADDGRGFSPPEAGPSLDRRSGLGLAGIVERAALAGGHATIESAPGRGTTVRVTVPLPGLDPAAPIS